MNKPRWQNSPQWFIGGSLGLAVVALGWLAGSWYAGTWKPGGEYALRFVLCLLLGVLFLLPDYVQYRREGDDYVGALLSRRIFLGGARGSSGWFIVGRLLFWALFWMLLNYRRFEPAGIAGVFIGMSLWYWFIRSLWRRMWELYEQDQSATPSLVAAGLPSAPEAR
ncbi:MAG: hypothetical protein WCP21_05580 [Armatimonadota bacterium]